MTLNEYQALTRETAWSPDVITPTYLCLGLGGEAGEVLEKHKRFIRLDYDGREYDYKSDMTSELGDVLWHIARLADELGLTLEDIARVNHAKLLSRIDRHTERGNGDYR